MTMAMHSAQLLMMVVVTVFFTKAATQLLSLPNCPTKCGSVTIPFPFGTTNDCSLDSTFLINCNKTSSSSTSSQVPYLLHGNLISVLNISLNGELHVALLVARDCYAEKSKPVSKIYRGINIKHFSISSTRNKLVAVGCDTMGALMVHDNGGNNYTTGCVALCNRLDDIVANEACSGIGCCEISIPQGHVLTEVIYTSTSVFNNHSVVHDFNPCGYAFLVENGAYDFKSTDLLKLEKKEFPVLLDWAVGNQTCQQAQKDLSNYAVTSFLKDEDEDDPSSYASTERKNGAANAAVTGSYFRYDLRRHRHDLIDDRV